MKLTAKTDIDVPLAAAFRGIADFDGWERAALRRGAEVVRTGGAAGAGVGTGWRIRFPFRGKIRTASITVIGLTPDKSAEFALDSPSMEGLTLVELSAQSPRRTRIRVTVEVKPKTLAARLFVNTLRLARGRVTRRFDARVQQIGADIAERYQRGQLGAAKG